MIARRENRIRIDIARHLAGDVPFARQAQSLRGESRVEATRLGFIDDRAIGLDEVGVDRTAHRPPGIAATDRSSNRVAKLCDRLPTIETVAIVAQKGSAGQPRSNRHRPEPARRIRAAERESDGSRRQ